MGSLRHGDKETGLVEEEASHALTYRAEEETKTAAEQVSVSASVQIDSASAIEVA